MKKKTEKRYIAGYMACLLCVLCAPVLPAQSVLELPELTTTISGESVAIPAEAIPDFTTVLPEKKESLPVLPEIDGDTAVPAESVPASGGRSGIYIEGIAGGGYPGFFTGDFAVYRTVGADPFLLHFMHETVNSYNTGSASDGYFRRSTSLDAQKKISISPQVAAGMDAQYLSFSTGLQQKSPLLFDLSAQQVGAGLSLDCLFTNTFRMETALDFDYNSQYAGFIQSDDSGLFPVDRFLFSPRFALKYDTKKAAVSFDAAYMLQTVSADTYDMVHRGSFVLSGLYDFVYFKAEPSVGVVIGDELVVPFSLRLSTALIGPLSEKAFSLSVAGGLRSTRADIKELQRLNPFCCIRNEPAEQSDWFCSATAEIPFGAAVSFGAGIDFAKTAFGNGTLSAIYCDEDGTYIPDAATGLFFAEYRSFTRFDTSFHIAYEVNRCRMSAGLVSRWLDAHDIDPANELTGEISLVSADGKAGSSIQAAYEIKKDAVPDCGFSAWYRFNNAFRLAVDVCDIVKLVTWTERTDCGSYITRGGYVSVTAKFNY